MPEAAAVPQVGATPRRIQRKRVKGWRKPAGTVDVTRGGMWGNPYSVLEDTSGWWVMTDKEHGLWHTSPAAAARTAVRMFCESIASHHDLVRSELAGRDLMCFCALCPAHAEGKPFGVSCPDCAPCHADALGDIANASA